MYLLNSINDFFEFQVRGRDYAIDLCGTLDILNPAVSLMIKCQSVNLPSWKIVTWFPKLMVRLTSIEDNLQRVLNGANPDKNVLPKLCKHWNDISLDNSEECTFQGEELLESWIVVGQETVDQVEEGAGEDSRDKIAKKRKGKKQAKTVYNWEARAPTDCISDLSTLCKELRQNLTLRYEEIVPTSSSKLSQIFDFEILISQLSNFQFRDGKLFIDREDRIEWERLGLRAFIDYFAHVCQLPHVRKYVDENSTSDLLPHSGQLIYARLKATLKQIVWDNLGGATHEIFKTKKGDDVSNFKCSQLVKYSVFDLELFKTFFNLHFSSGEKVEAYLDEEILIKMLYTNKEIYESLGKECCLALDVALATSGCEAIVEGFYSVVKAHAKSGGQSNKVLMERAVVDWALPNPLSCPQVMLHIGKIYTKGDSKHSLPSHRVPVFYDIRDRASGKYKTSKVVDRIANEAPRCPFIVCIDEQE